jgi:hypothetical protein
MLMKIAVLGWGSLLWEKFAISTEPPSIPPDAVLRLTSDWVLGGPELPIEFSRVSSTRKGALTLVIDKKNGVSNPTYFAVSSYSNVNEAINNLRTREGTAERFIGYVNRINGRSRSGALSVDSQIMRDCGAWEDER